jgi:hypothetical protein
LKTLWANNAPNTRARYADGLNVQVQEISDIDALGSQIGSNHQAFKQADASLAKAVYKYMVAANKTLEEVAAKCGYSTAHLSNILSLNTLPEMAQKAVNEGKMTLNNAFQLAKLPANVVDDQWVEKALNLKGDEFVAEVAKTLNEIKKEKRLGTEARPVEFAPSARLRTKDELTVMLEQSLYAFKAEASDYNRGVKDALEKAFQLDETSINAQKAEWDKNKAEAEESKKKRAADREAKRLEEAKKFVEEHGGTISLN